MTDQAHSWQILPYTSGQEMAAVKLFGLPPLLGLDKPAITST